MNTNTTGEVTMISYTKVPVPEGAIKLSPSGLSKFRRNPKEWLGDLKGNSTFTGNLATVRGTLTHYVFESRFDNRTEACFTQDCLVYVNNEVDLGTITDEEGTALMESLPEIYTACNDWAEDVDDKTILASEPVVKSLIPTNVAGTVNDYYIAGSIDAVVTRINADGETEYGIRDYKTSSRKMTSLASYKPQLLTYAVGYTENNPGTPITFLEVINISTTKTKGIQFNVIEEDVKSHQVKQILGFYDEIIAAHQTAVKYPQFEAMLFREGSDFTGRIDIFT